MSKFHINKHGVPAPCRAKSGNCPLGGDDQHFKTEQEAQDFADNQGEQKHGLLPGMNKDAEKYVEKGGKNKHGLLTKDGKERRRAKAEFRFTKAALDKYKGKFVEVDYDDSSFSGEVIDTHFDSEEDSGLIIQNSNGEFKHIKNYRMHDVLVTANDKDGYEHQVKQLNDFDDQVNNDFQANFTKENSDSHQDYYVHEMGEDTVNPDSLADSYFEAVIDRAEKGRSINEEEFEYDWQDEIERNSDNYVIDNGGGDERWTDESDDNFEHDLEVAEKVGNYYDEQKAFIDHVEKKAQEVDWESTGKSQRQGVVDALKKVYKEQNYR